MSIVVPFKDNTFYKAKLPIELIHHVMSIGDIAQYIIIRRDNSISIIDYNTHTLLRSIHMLNVQHVSVSKCGNYIVGSDELRICIWNIEDCVLVQEIQAEYVHNMTEYQLGFYRHSNHGQPVHTFTKNNNLLIGSGRRVKLLSLENNIWIEQDTFEIPKASSIITYITANKFNNMFACGDSIGDVYIYDYNTRALIHNFTTRLGLLRSDHASSITSIAFNRNILVVSSVGRNNILLNLSTMTSIKIQEPTHHYFGSYFTIKNYMLTPDLTKFIGTLNNITYMWDASTGLIIKELDVIIDNECSFSPQGHFIITYNWINDIRIIKFHSL